MLNFEHILRGNKTEAKFKARWTEYKNKCEEVRLHGYSIYLGEEQGPPPIGILESIRDRQGNLIEIEPDKEYKQELRNLINELLKIARRSCDLS